MHRDIVQVAESILQFLECGDERFPPPPRFLAGERAGKEFRGVAELLGLQAHLVPPFGIEFAEARARFQNLFPASPQLVGGRAHDRLFSQQAGEVVGVAGPVAGFDPAGSIENKAAKAWRFDRRKGARKRLLPSLLDVLDENCHSRPIPPTVRQRLHDAADEHIKLARRAQFLRDPPELLFHLLRLRIVQHVGK